jgi:hypothetical protein
VVAGPVREWYGLSGATEHGKGQDENKNLSAPVHRGGHQIVPLDEILGTVLPQVELTEEADRVVAEDGRVDTNEQVAEVPGDDASVKIRPDALVGEESMHEIEWKRDHEAHKECRSNPLVTGSKREHFRSNGPGNGQGVEHLNVGTRPDVGTFNRHEDVGLVLDNPIQGLDEAAGIKTAPERQSRT